MRKLSLEELNRLDATAFAEAPKIPVVVILDNIRSALNVGSVFRTADAFSIRHIFLCGITAQPPHREILKTAIGATDTVDWSYEPTIETLVRQLKEEEYSIWAIEQTDQSKDLQAFDWKALSKIAVIFGNEVGGVSEEVLPLIDGAIEIPQYGTKHSLNVSVCAGIVLWELIKSYK